MLGSCYSWTSRSSSEFISEIWLPSVQKELKNFSSQHSWIQLWPVDIYNSATASLHGQSNSSVFIPVQDIPQWSLILLIQYSNMRFWLVFYFPIELETKFHNCTVGRLCTSKNLVCLWAAGTRIRRLICHPTEQSCVMSAVQGNNEISVWNLETHFRQTVLWASNAPPLTHTTVSSIQSTPSVLWL